MIKTPERYSYAELIALYLVVVSEVYENEPSSALSSLASKEKTQCLEAINEEMKSLHLNNT